MFLAVSALAVEIPHIGEGISIAEPLSFAPQSDIVTVAMRFWWVNQNQTFTQEVSGGYLWSPRRNANGARNPFYEFMREVAPGDLVLSFQGTYIRAIGVAQSFAYESPKPPEFGPTGPNWDRIGWRVDVRYVRLANQIRPADHMDGLRPLLPQKYSPLLQDGRGLQSVYLTELPQALMNALADLIGQEARSLVEANNLADDVGSYGKGLTEWEEHLRGEVESDSRLDQTEKLQIVMARRGQGLFKENVRRIEQHCRITGVERLEHLRASHIQPWRDSDNHARLDGENGLLLTPSVDHLFDRGFISFEDNGRPLISPVAHRESLRRMAVPIEEPVNVGAFSDGQCRYLDFHRNAVFLEARKG